jgi:hypothetical protein
VKRFFSTTFPVALTIGIGIVTLILYLVPGMMNNPGDIVRIRGYWVEVAVIIAAFAMLLGLSNFLVVHWSRIRHRRHGWFFSFISIVAAWLVLAASAGDFALTVNNGQAVFAQGIAGPNMKMVYDFGLYPLQSSFAALLAFVLGLAAFRTLRLRQGLNAWLFVAAVVIVLTGQAFGGMVIVGDMVRPIRDLFVDVLATASLRGVLLGIGLGTLATIVRIWIIADRPVGE